MSGCGGRNGGHNYSTASSQLAWSVISILNESPGCRDELDVHIVKGVLARDHIQMFLSIPPKLSLSDVMQCIKGRSSRRIQMEFPDLRKRYLGRRFWARGYFSTTSGNVTDDVIKQYMELHSTK